MPKKNGIAWTDETWNPIRGCSKVTAGCAHCYAEAMATRFCGPGQPYEGLVEDGRWNGKVRLILEHLDDPIRWQRPRRIFVNSMSDLFHESLSFKEIAAIFGVMAASPQHIFQVLTKRADRMREFFRWIESQDTGLATTPSSPQLVAAAAAQELLGKQWTVPDPGLWPLPNLWLGVSVEDQAGASRLLHLRDTPAAVRWVSMEPLLGPVDLTRIPEGEGGDFYNALTGESVSGATGCVYREGPPLDWVVVGGESGKDARPMHPDFARAIRDHCKAAFVPYLFKQYGEWGPSAVHMTSHQAVFRVFTNYDHWAAKAPTWMAKGDIILDANGKRCRVSGDLMTGQAPFTVLRRVGKKAAGRILDGELHDAYPAVMGQSA